MQSAALFALAARYTLDWRGGYLSGVLSLLSVLGLVLAIALLVLVLSVMNGFDREMRDNILSAVPHLTLRAWTPAAQWEDAAAVFKRHPQVAGFAPFVELQGMFVNGNTVETTQLFGLPTNNPAVAAQLARVAGAEGWAAFGDNAEGLLLGSALAEALGLAPGDGVTLIVPGGGAVGNSAGGNGVGGSGVGGNGAAGSAAGSGASGVVGGAVGSGASGAVGGAVGNSAARFQRLRLSGLVHTGTELDQAAAFLHIDTAARLAGRPGAVDGYRLQLRDLFQAPQVGWELVSALPPRFYARDWTTTHGNLYSAIQLSRDMVGLLLFSIIAIAAFNLVSSLVLVVVDKRSDIAILRAMGASAGDISGVFVRQGLLIAAVGMALGTGLGALGSLWVTEAVRGIEWLFGFRFLNTDVYPIGYMPSDLRWGDVVRVNGAALLLCFLASLYPARRAAKLLPAEALRHE